MSVTINRILVAMRDLHHPPLNELRKAAAVARAAGASMEIYHATDVPIRSDEAPASLGFQTLLPFQR